PSPTPALTDPTYSPGVPHPSNRSRRDVRRRHCRRALTGLLTHACGRPSPSPPNRSDKMPSRTSPFSSTSSLSRPLTLVAAAIGLVLTLLTVACAEPAGRGDSNGARASGEAPQDTIFIDQVGYDLGDPDAPVI